MSRTRTCARLMLFLMFATAHAASAQSRISGKVIDPAGQPVAGVEVLLHAVEESSGNQIDKDTTVSDGTFRVDARRVDPKAVYFVAVVYNSQLFIGDMMRAPFPQGQDYIVQVGVNPVDLRPATAVTDVPPANKAADRTAGLAVMITAAALICGVVFFAVQRRPPTRRRWLVELAHLEDEIAARPDHKTLRKRRAELRTRLRAPASG